MFTQGRRRGDAPVYALRSVVVVVGLIASFIHLDQPSKAAARLFLPLPPPSCVVEKRGSNFHIDLQPS